MLLELLLQAVLLERGEWDLEIFNQLFQLEGLIVAEDWVFLIDHGSKLA